MNEILFQSATAAADMVRRKEISSRELTELLLAWIDAVNPALNTVVELRCEAALQEATVADRALAAGLIGPLHGVLITIKGASTLPAYIPPGTIQRSRTTWRTRMRRWWGG